MHQILIVSRRHKQMLRGGNKQTNKHSQTQTNPNPKQTKKNTNQNHQTKPRKIASKTNTFLILFRVSLGSSCILCFISTNIVPYWYLVPRTGVAVFYLYEWEKNLGLSDHQIFNISVELLIHLRTGQGSFTAAKRILRWLWPWPIIYFYLCCFFVCLQKSETIKNTVLYLSDRVYNIGYFKYALKWIDLVFSHMYFKVLFIFLSIKVHGLPFLPEWFSEVLQF